MSRPLRNSLLFIFVLCVATCSGSAQSPSTPPQAHQQATQPPLAPVDQEQFASYWTTETGWHTELQLRNNLEGQDLSVTPALRTANGVETALPAVTIKSGDVVSVDLYETLMKAAPQLAGAWGSLVLRYRSVVHRALYAAVMVRADGRPTVFHLDAYGRGTKYEVGSREGIWWLPWDRVTDYLILTNSGDQELATSLILYDSSGKAWQQKLTLSARETRRLSIRSLLQQAGLHGSYGGIKIDMAKGARYLDSAHLLFDESGGFSAIMKMFKHNPNITLLSRSFRGVKEWTTRAPMLALSAPDPALGFPAGTTLLPQLFIHNATGKAFTAHVYFNWRSATASGKSAPLDLAFKPNETQVLDVAALQAQKLLPADAQWAAVILSAPVLPDELLAVAASYDPSGRYGTQTPFNDQLASHWEAGAWEVDGTHNSLVTINNGGNKPALAQITILYNHGTGQYQLEQTLAPDEQMALDFGKLIHDQVPDKNGHTLPHDLAWGTYRILDLTDEAAGGLYEGKVILDKTYGHAAYGCMICCGPESPWMLYDPLSVAVSGFQNQAVQALNSCTSRLATITGDFPTWWTDNTSIATASGYQINGVAAGATNHNAQSIMMYWGPKEDAPSCDQSQEQASAGTNVTPAISGPNTVWYFGGQSPSGYATSITLTSSGGAGTTWSVTTKSNLVNLSTTSGSQTTITSTGSAFSSSVGDITIQATTNNQNSPAFQITSRAPSTLAAGTITTTCDATYGYNTLIGYTVKDNLSVVLPSLIGVNEAWTTVVQIDYSGSNWRRSAAGGSPTNQNAGFSDQIQGEASGFVPTASCTGANTAVHHFGQDWRVGSQTSGLGRRVQSDVLQKYINHAAHNNIVTPNP